MCGLFHGCLNLGLGDQFQSSGGSICLVKTPYHYAQMLHDVLYFRYRDALDSQSSLTPYCVAFCDVAQLTQLPRMSLNPNHGGHHIATVGNGKKQSEWGPFFHCTTAKSWNTTGLFKKLSILRQSYTLL